MKQKEQLINENYLNKRQIARMLDVTIPKAMEIYARAEEVDIQQLPYRLEERKVRTKTVLKVMGLTYEDLKKRMAP